MVTNTGASVGGSDTRIVARDPNNGCTAVVDVTLEDLIARLQVELAMVNAFGTDAQVSAVQPLTKGNGSILSSRTGC